MRQIFQSKLKDKTQELLQDTHILLKTISHDTGLSESWLSAFKLGLKIHPDVGRIETLYNYLSNTQLKV